jgi:hypothetical protein
MTRHSSKFRDAAQNAIATCAGIAASDYLVGCIDGLALLWLDAREAAVLAISISRLGIAAGVASSRRAAIAGSRAGELIPRRCAGRRRVGFTGAVTKRERRIEIRRSQSALD